MTTGMILNRCYIDTYAFYIPYRLLWSSFPAFVSDKTGTIPKVTNTFPANFEKVLTLTTKTENVAFQRRCYNKVFNEYFRRDEETEAGEDDNSVLNTSFRPSTFHEAATEGPRANASIDTSGTSTDIQSVRAAFATDQFNRAREYYGERYVDFLAALGVEASWSIIDSPEMVGKHSGKMDYQIVNPTAANATTPEGAEGRPGGYYRANFTLNIPKTFCPEHGLIGIYTNAKMQLFYDSNVPPQLTMDDSEDYWSPEYDISNDRLYDSTIWTQTGSGTPYMPRWQHLRQGYNMTAQEDASQYNYAAIVDSGALNTNQWKGITAAAVDATMQGNIGNTPGGANTAHYCASVDYNLTKDTHVGTILGRPLR
jgi:hypothetical protein